MSISQCTMYATLRGWDICADCTDAELHILQELIQHTHSGVTESTMYNMLYYTVWNECSTVLHHPLELEKTLQHIIRTFNVDVHAVYSCNNSVVARQILGKMWFQVMQGERRRMDAICAIFQLCGVDCSEYLQNCTHHHVRGYQSIPSSEILLCALQHKLPTVYNLIRDGLWYEHTGRGTKIKIMLSQRRNVYPLTGGFGFSEEYWGTELYPIIYEAYAGNAEDVRVVAHPDPVIRAIWYRTSTHNKKHFSDLYFKDTIMTHTAVRIENALRANCTRALEWGTCDLMMFENFRHILWYFSDIPVLQSLMMCDVYGEIDRIMCYLCSSGYIFQCTSAIQFEWVRSKCSIWKYFQDSNSTQFPYLMHNQSDIDIMYNLHSAQSAYCVHYFNALLLFQQGLDQVTARCRARYTRVVREILQDAGMYIPRDLLHFIAMEYADCAPPTPLVYDRTNIKLCEFLAGTRDITQLWT